MLHIWLIPLLILLAVVLAAFYVIIRVVGGSGVRSEGRTVLHKEGEEPSDED